MKTKNKMMKFLGFFLLLAVLIPAHPVKMTLAATTPTTVYVDAAFDEQTEGWGVTHFASIQAGLGAVAENGVVEVAPETYHEPDGIIVNKAVTILLASGTLIQNNAACFLIEANYVSIVSSLERNAVCVPGEGAHGLDVAAGLTNFHLMGLEIDGTGQTTADGIHFQGAITDFHLYNNLIHGLGGHGIHFSVEPTPTRYNSIRGNLFMNNAGFGIHNADPILESGLDVTYNSWGDYDGPFGPDGDGLSDNILFYDPWTHVDLALLFLSDFDEQAVWGDEVIYVIYGNFRNVSQMYISLLFDRLYLELTDVIYITPLFDDYFVRESTLPGTINYVGFWDWPRSGRDVWLAGARFLTKRVGTTELEFTNAAFRTNDIGFKFSSDNDLADTSFYPITVYPTTLTGSSLSIDFATYLPLIFH